VAHRPELLILDEPAGGLDPAARREFLETSIQLLNREGTAILFSSHHMSDVERLGGRVVLLDQGRIRVDDDLDALREAYCVAVIPRYAAHGVRDIERMPECLKVRRRSMELHAVFRGTPDQVRVLLHDNFGLSNVQCATVPLEELFIELVGGERPVEAS
jgi:ABC-2 type transport system ATP-binding protein